MVPGAAIRRAWADGSARPLATLAEHHLEAFPQLQVAGLRQGRERGVAVQELLAADLAAAADVAALAHQRPAAEQVGLEHELDEAGSFVAFGALLHQQSHARIVGSLPSSPRTRGSRGSGCGGLRVLRGPRSGAGCRGMTGGRGSVVKPSRLPAATLPKPPPPTSGARRPRAPG